MYKHIFQFIKNILHLMHKAHEITIILHVSY